MPLYRSCDCVRRDILQGCEGTDLGVVEGDELVTQSANLTIHHKTLEVNVSSTQAGQTGGLVAATGLDADEAVLNLFRN